MISWMRRCFMASDIMRWCDIGILDLPIRAACCFSTSMISVPMAADRAYINIRSSVFVFHYTVMNHESPFARPNSISFLSFCVDLCERMETEERETRGKESIQQRKRDKKMRTYHHTINLLCPISDHIPQSALFIRILIQTSPGLAIPWWHCRVMWYNSSMVMACSQNVGLNGKVARIICG